MILYHISDCSPILPILPRHDTQSGYKRFGGALEIAQTRNVVSLDVKFGLLHLLLIEAGYLNGGGCRAHAMMPC